MDINRSECDVLVDLNKSISAMEVCGVVLLVVNVLSFTVPCQSTEMNTTGLSLIWLYACYFSTRLFVEFMNLCIIVCNRRRN